MAETAITAITAASGLVSITAEGDGSVTVYGRRAGTLAWSQVATADDTTAAIPVTGLTAGYAYEFYIVTTDAGVVSSPSNVARVFVYADGLSGIVNIERWIIGQLTDLGVFKTVDSWRSQIADGGGPAAYQKYAPFAFVTFNHIAPSREGDYDLNRKVGFVIFVGAYDDTPGVSRIGSNDKPGSSYLMDMVISALDDKHPGEGFTIDRIYFTESQIIVNSEKMSEIYLGFEAGWIIPSTNI